MASIEGQSDLKLEANSAYLEFSRLNQMLMEKPTFWLTHLVLTQIPTEKNAKCFPAIVFMTIFCMHDTKRLS
jgi:hypothetical protein